MNTLHIIITVLVVLLSLAAVVLGGKKVYERHQQNEKRRLAAELWPHYRNKVLRPTPRMAIKLVEGYVESITIGKEVFNNIEDVLDEMVLEDEEREKLENLQLVIPQFAQFRSQNGPASHKIIKSEFDGDIYIYRYTTDEHRPVLHFDEDNRKGKLRLEIVPVGEVKEGVMPKLQIKTAFYIGKGHSYEFKVDDVNSPEYKSFKRHVLLNEKCKKEKEFFDRVQEQIDHYNEVRERVTKEDGKYIITAYITEEELGEETVVEVMEAAPKKQPILVSGGKEA